MLKDFMKTKKAFREFFEKISPILIDPTSSSITISLSKRFLLFDLLSKITYAIDEDPHLNFVSALKYYKVLGRFLNGSIKEMYRDRHKFYFKSFFLHEDIYRRICEDIEHVYEINPNVMMTLSKDGIVIYDNYKKDDFNILLMTAHAGSFIPLSVERKMVPSPLQRWREEDVDSDRLYCRIVLKQAGIWIDNKLSRFYCDVNRRKENCVYKNRLGDQVKGKVWDQPLKISELNRIYDFYDAWYATLSRLLDSYKFNIIFDAHTMKHKENRPDISFGTHYIPKFYLPIVKSMRSKIRGLGYERSAVNSPYGGGYILKWLSTQYPSLFTFSMEVNKKLYMTRDWEKTFAGKVDKIAEDLVQIFDIVEEEGFRMKDS